MFLTNVRRLARRSWSSPLERQVRRWQARRDRRRQSRCPSAAHEADRLALASTNIEEGGARRAWRRACGAPACARARHGSAANRGRPIPASCRQIPLAPAAPTAGGAAGEGPAVSSTLTAGAFTARRTATSQSCGVRNLRVVSAPRLLDIDERGRNGAKVAAGGAEHARDSFDSGGGRLVGDEMRDKLGRDELRSRRVAAQVADDVLALFDPRIGVLHAKHRPCTRLVKWILECEPDRRLAGRARRSAAR